MLTYLAKLNEVFLNCLLWHINGNTTYENLVCTILESLKYKKVMFTFKICFWVGRGREGGE